MDATRYREILTRPGEPAEVNTEPDGTIELHWPAASLTVLLSRGEAQALVAELLGAFLDNRA